MQFDQAGTHFEQYFLPSRIGSKSMGIKAQIGLKFMDLLPIRPGINYWSNWVEIHLDYSII